ncbi:HD domain-containing protein [Chitinibacter sp. SCUT-21]|uniref:HD domain-containing protein n=1 Tax=Chitinibacter sp. SCUT-21 TaxID=2970891 RepID=UPI0035A58224
MLQVDAMSSMILDWRERLIDLARVQTADDGAHDLNHLHRVWQNAQQLLASHPEADQLIVLAACYLHDIINLPKNDPQRHLASQLAASKAGEILQSLGFPSEKLAGVQHAIAAHSYSAGLGAHSIEAQIVQDADRLDALGAVGLARLYYTAGRMGSALAHADDPLALNRALDDKRYALDHIEVKLATLPATMHTATAQQLGLQRLAALREFRQQFAAEWGATSD